MAALEIQRRAVRAVRAAVRSGELVRGACYAAGPRCLGRIEGHHHDYSKPLDVVWTCRRHHRPLDRQRSDYAIERTARFHARKAKKARAAEFMRLLEFAQLLPNAGVLFHAGWFPASPPPRRPVARLMTVGDQGQ
jgi:hypothetical protein